MHSMEEIYRQYSNTIYKYLVYLTNNEDIAEDLVQETFAIAVKQIGKFRGECKMSTWLCQIAKHLWYKELKKKQKDTSIAIDELPQEIAENILLEDVVLKNEQKLQLFKDMQSLDNLSREVMYLRTIGDLSFIEISEILGKTPNWARVTFFRAKQKIREVNENGKKK